MPAKPRWSLRRQPLIWAVVVFFCDQATKFWAVGLSRPKDIIPGLLSLAPINNSAILFGLWHIPHLKLFTIAFSLLVVYFTLNLWKESQQRWGRGKDFGIGLIWGGMMGNFTDRLISGFVFDFISLWRIPVFNLADAGLTIGATVITVHLLFAPKEKDVVQ
ncbi:MAG: signal peptidase II [Candidatus Omnitrophota bacterium]